MLLSFRSFLKISILWLPPFIVWLFFLHRYGDTVKTSLWPYYLLLSPLSIYLLFFLSYFQRVRGPQTQSRWKKGFRIGCIVVLSISLLDALGASLNRYAYQRIVDGDWRYSIFIHNWLQKQNLEIPPTSSDSAPGPFVPFVKGNSIDSDITADKWGFRRELPDAYANLSTEETVNVLCLGGSVMFGMTTEKDDLPPPDWLQKALLEEGFPPIRVYNAAFPGAHAGAISSPEQTAYWQIHPDIIFFYEAINWLAPGQKSFMQRYNSLLMTWFRNWQVRRDSIRAVQHYNPQKYGEKLLEFIERCRTNDKPAVPVLMTFSLPFSEQDSSSELAYWDCMQNGQGCAYAAAVQVRKHNEKLIEIAQKERAPIIDTRPFLNDRPEFFIDSCHLTQEGSKILADLMAERVADLSERGVVR